MARVPQTIALGKIHVIQANMLAFYLDHPFLETATEEQIKELAASHRGQKCTSNNLWYYNQQYAHHGSIWYSGQSQTLLPGEKCLQTNEKSWGKTQLPWFVPVSPLTKYGNVGLYFIKALFEDKFVWFTRLGPYPIPWCFSRIKTETEEAQFIKVNDRKNKKKTNED